MKRQLAAAIILITASVSFGQSLPVFLDGRTDEWNSSVPTHVDTENDGSNYDFKYISAANDEKFLYLKLKVTPFVKLLENNQLAIYIDGDNNTATGYQINGIGAELVFNFGSRNGYDYHAGASITHSEIKFRSLPTVTDTVFEIAIAKQAIPPAGTPASVKIFLIDNVTSGDRMPDQGQTFSFTFDDTPTGPFNPVEIAKEDSSLLRVMNWNVLNDGLTSSNREQYFRRLLQVLEPDIAGFSEMWNSTASEVQTKLNSILPLQSGSWHTVKLDGGNIIASRYPVIQSWLVYPGQRITASLIDLPERYGSDMLVICCHYKCCGGASNDQQRQREADATVAFILDAKSPGGNVTLAPNTPFVIMGDLNFVGDRQQLLTLQTGQIINTQLFGNGAPPDWDNTELEDVVSGQTDKRTAYTWRDDEGSYPPGRLDFQIYPNSVVNVTKGFVLQTEVMTQERLNKYGFLPNDSKNASDHFPKVSDISFNTGTGIAETGAVIDLALEQNFPNPFNPFTRIEYKLARRQNVIIRIYDALGREVAELVNGIKPEGRHELLFDAAGLGSGIYFCVLATDDVTVSRKMLLAK